MGIADLRREYNLSGLRRDDLDSDPIVQFNRWFKQASGARASGRLLKFFVGLYKSLLMIRGLAPVEVNSMTLATADAQGRPSARTVLLKGVDQRGFVFFTNYDSRKGHELEANPHAALVFYWADLERQVCIAGDVVRLPRSESEDYFKSRPRGSRIAAWASTQSEVVENRVALEDKWRAIEQRYPGEDIPMPSFWGGFVLAPVRLEFWQGRPNRLHDRFRYTRMQDGAWKIERLAP
jgi:pyridoxamine 5'-phosphate oxidase